MDSQKRAALAIIIAMATKRRKRTRWTKEWLLKRYQYTHVNLLNEIRNTNEDLDYANYFRMKDACFDELLKMVEPYLKKQDTNMRKSISPGEKLSLTLRYFATGRNIEDLKFSVIMSPAAISDALMTTCEALIYVLQSYIKMPTTEEEWKLIASDFGEAYQFWNCLGALDGKHIAIKKPAYSGSLYFNYKGYCSIVLMALVNSKKEFIMIDTGTNGRISDGGVLFYTKFWEMYEQNQLNIPAPSRLPNTTQKFPYVFISDEAFALGTNLMKPYPQTACNAQRKVFNYRLSRARSVVEGAFGILSSKFGVFQTPILFAPKKAAIVVTACCYLHNYLLKTQPRRYLASNWNITRPHNEHLLVDLESAGTRNSPTDAKLIRDNFCEYFNNEGYLDIRKIE